jgi:hypothetical protein
MNETFRPHTDNVTTAEVDVLLVKLGSALLAVVGLGKDLKTSTLESCQPWPRHV